MKIVNVIPLKKGVLKGDLTYFTTKDIENGSIVTINLRNKKVFGLTISSEEVSTTKMDIKGMNFNLKKIIEVKGKSIFLKEYIDSILETSNYFASTKSSALASLLPSIFIEEYDKLNKFENKKNIGKSQKIQEPKNEKLILQESLENRISIYKTLIRENFAIKKSVFVVLPTESDIELFKEQLSKGIEQFTYDFSANISSKKIIEKFKDIVNTEHPVLILGTAPFLAIPRDDIGLIVLEHENSNGYRMIARPHFDLRTFTEIFASNINAKFIISSTLLRFETIARQELDGLVSMHPLSFRIDFNKNIIIENPTSEYKKRKTFRVFSEASIKDIKNSIQKDENIFVFTLRKGLATSTLCMDCSSVVSCEKCQAPLVLYNSEAGKKRMFACNRCGEEKNTEIKCKDCDSWNLKPFGIGTDTVYEELREIFPKIKILKLDKESAKTKKGAESIIDDFEKNKGAILIGTEMALFYMTRKVGLSIVASFDSFWSIPSFRMSEKVLQLVTSIISYTENKFIIQTKNEEDPVITSIKSRNLLSIIRRELEDRKKLGYPPYKRFIKIKHLGNKLETIKAKKIMEETLFEYKPLVFSGFIAQTRGKYVTNALIKLEPKDWSVNSLTMGGSIDENLFQKLSSLPFSFEIFIDPEELF